MNTNFLSIAENRYTTKKYDPSKKISAENIEQLKKIARLSPSSIDSQPWKFIFISDEKVKDQLAEASYFNATKIKEASHLVVFNAVDNVQLFESKMKEYLPDGAIDYYNNFLKPLPESELKAWFQHQVYLSLGFFLSACASMGIDSTPMEGIEAEKYAKILNISGYKPLFAVAIGYRDAQDNNQPSITPKSRLNAEEVIQVI